MKLLLDMGNTRLKWALTSDRWLAHGAVGWNEDLDAALTEGLTSWPRPDIVLAASVVDSTREALIAAIVMRLCAQPIHWRRSPAAACGVRNAYAEPQRLGVDRFLTMVAAHAHGGGPHVLAGVGTALTLDALATDGRHLGGLIAPGPMLMQQTLLSATAQVRMDAAGRVQERADNTTDAVVSGCWLAAVALIERFVGQSADDLGARPTLCLSGGDAEQLVPLLSMPAQVTHNAVLRGLALWADADE
ncbi:type III pantothenate kinase [Rhodanobacter sp. Root627]|uniref:type III pantothenate kinase n=1 Tax=Rhodanobacter sp. Root627 TaxID=1736572 RepID=UPI0006FE74BA|nr:type III pantothenate kinase [Rhodanobacter sp. Root627]KRA33157.1 type III pantothenate kinase [Rhodanobacter sp. Root627]